MSQGQAFRAEAVTSKTNKVCSKCLADKALSDFGIDRAARDGLRYICKACSNALSKAYGAANKEALKERESKRRIEDPGAGARHSLKWRQTHPERAKAGYLRYGAENKAKIAAKDAKKYAKDPAKAARQYAKWVANNPESVRTRAANRRARKKGAGGRHTRADILELLVLQKSRCAACKCDIKHKYHVDHITAIAKGGSNDRLNLQLLCRKCNLTKHAKDPIDFMQMKGYLI